MKAKLAKKLVSSLAASAVLVSVFAACDLGLTPYVATEDSGTTTIIDSGNTVIDTGVVDSGSDASDAGDASTGPKIVFVTSTKFAGDFNGQHGQAGADAICQSLGIKASGKAAARFVAWISESGAGKSALEHVTDVGPWYLTDRKTLVFANKAAIASLPLKAISLDESGNDLGILDNSRVWTGTLFSGSVGGGQPVQATCLDWTSGIGTNAAGYAGDPSSRSADWTQKESDNCATSNRLYCFEQ